MSTTYIEVSYYSDNFCLTKRHFGKYLQTNSLLKKKINHWKELGERKFFGADLIMKYIWAIEIIFYTM